MLRDDLVENLGKLVSEIVSKLCLNLVPDIIDKKALKSVGQLCYDISRNVNLKMVSWEVHNDILNGESRNKDSRLKALGSKPESKGNCELGNVNGDRALSAENRKVVFEVL